MERVANRAANPLKEPHFPLTFESKQNNIVGVQVGDLCARPCARHILHPTRPNRAFETARMPGYARGNVKGWKVFP